jgi:hypothetical protein
MAADRRAQLEATLADNPDDVATWHVYADALLEAGEAWGKQIIEDNPPLDDDLLGGLDGSKVEWKHGTIDRIELRPSEDPDGDPPYPMVRALQRLLAHPAGRLVRRISLGLPPVESGGTEWSFDTIIPVLAAARLPLLRELDMTGSATHMDQNSWRRIGDLSSVWPAMPQLRDLRMLGASGSDGGVPCVLGAIAAPYLDTFVFESGGLSRQVSLDLGRATLPALRHLELWFGRDDYGNDHAIADLDGILRGDGLPALQYLGLRNSEWQAELIEAVVQAPITKRIRVLDLSMGVLREEGAAALVANADKLRHLELVELTDNFLPDADCERLRAALPNAGVAGQREADEYDGKRYYFTSVGE